MTDNTELIEELQKSISESQKNMEFLELHLAEFSEKGYRERIISILSQLAFCKYCDTKHLKEITENNSKNS